MNVAIIDDEKPARDNLKKFIEDNFDFVETIVEADSVQSGLHLLQSTSVDLLLLDINLSDGSGFNILEQIATINFRVVFVTAYDAYAVKAFKYNALDYILKPIELTELMRVFDKMRAVPEDRYLNREALDCILEDYSKNDLDRKIVVQESRKVSFIAIKEIIYLESQGNYTYLHITKGSKILSSNSLKVFEDMLPETAFMRVHKSFIININHLLSYNKEEGGFISMVNGSEVSVSRRRKNNFIEVLKKRFS